MDKRIIIPPKMCLWFYYLFFEKIREHGKTPIANANTSWCSENKANPPLETYNPMCAKPSEHCNKKKYIEKGDNGDDGDEANPMKSHKIHFDGDPNKPINIEYHTVFGEIHGLYKLYDRNGKLLSEALYHRGKLNGDSIEYNVYMRQHDGSMKIMPKYIRTYENGIEMSQKTISYTDTGARKFDNA